MDPLFSVGIAVVAVILLLIIFSLCYVKTSPDIALLLRPTSRGKRLVCPIRACRGPKEHGYYQNAHRKWS